ncbi:MAG: RNA polymerase sigma factor [Chloroflexota bacterium]
MPKVSEMADNQLDDLLHRGYRYALSLTHDADSAQDLLQESCLRITRRGGPWQIHYLITTIRNGYIDGYRRAQKIEFSSLDHLDIMGDIDVQLTSLDPTLEAALAQLRFEERELLYLSIMEGYTASDLAALMDKPRGTILSTLHRAKRKLRELLSEVEAVGQ